MDPPRPSNVGRDMIELKLQQKLLKAQLAENEKKSDKLNLVMVKKMMSKTSSIYIGAPRPDHTTAVGGAAGKHTVSEYRMPRRGHGTDHGSISLPSLARSELPTVQEVGFGSDMDAIRIRHMQRTQGNKEVSKRTKEKERFEREKKEKQKKRVLIAGNVPSSMFPNRYARGELPCSIEHGRGGQYLSWVCPLENLDYDYYLPIFFDGTVNTTLHLLSSLKFFLAGLQVDAQPVSFFVRQVHCDRTHSRFFCPL